MFRFLLVIASLVASNFLYAHQPDQSSIMLVEKGEGVWILQVRAALTAFEYEVHSTFGEESYKTPEEFNQLVLTHLRNNINIVVNNNTVNLQGGSVKLGHETSVLFELENNILELQNVSVTQKSFVDISRNQSALVLFKKGLKPQQFIMDQSNDHQMSLEFRGDAFVPISLVSEGIVAHSHMWQYLLGGALLLLLLFFGWKKIRSNTIK